MAKFPIDAPLDQVLVAMAKPGLQVVRSGNYIALACANDDGTQSPKTIPNHRRLKGSTLRTILTQSGISRDEFLNAYGAN